MGRSNRGIVKFILKEDWERMWETVDVWLVEKGF